MCTCGGIDLTRRTSSVRGKVEELKALAAASGVGVVVFDVALSPAQQRNLERALGVWVLDRTALILDIFSQRARSREGKLQVELAQLEHLATRLVRDGRTSSASAAASVRPAARAKSRSNSTAA